MPQSMRDYRSLLAAAAPPAASEPRDVAMQRVVDLLWEALHEQDVSWIGFYLDQPDQADDRRLVLGPCRDRPACSPIGLHGVCGASLRSRQTQVVHDVADLGPDYIACDPRDASEIVIPLSDSADVCWGVLDVDSWKTGAFSEADDVGLRSVLAAARLLPG